MIDYNVSDHWSADDPDWLKSLASSLERRHDASAILPLTVIVAEVLEWLELASGIDAWRTSANRSSLQLDIDEAVRALGPSLAAHVNTALTQFQATFSTLTKSPRRLLEQAPGTRADAVWTDAVSTATNLLAVLDGDTATQASWDDLVTTAQDHTLAGQEYRPIANLLFDQLRRRGLDAATVFRNLVTAVALGRGPLEPPLGATNLPPDERLRNARSYVGTPAETEPTVVWLGYQDGAFPHLSAGQVSFMNAHWAVPNAAPDGQSFEHKDELWQLVQGGYMFKVAELVDETSDVDVLVRVDLGSTTAAGAVDRAIEIVDTILTVSIHSSGGTRPHLVQQALLRNGRSTTRNFGRAGRETGFHNDHYGARMTAESIEEHGPCIAEALARHELPRFLAAALEVQTAAELPFSREMALRKPSDADIRSVIPLADRVVQHVAAYAALEPKLVFDLLGKHWAHARWLADVQRAVGICLLSGRIDSKLRREWVAVNPRRPWILYVADNADGLLALCRVESERAWIERMFASVSEHAEYNALLETYTAEGVVLDARRRRVRNALEHGNPTSFRIIESVREYAEFLSRSALHYGLESYVDGAPFLAALASRSSEFNAMQTGLDAAHYWRDQLAARASAANGPPVGRC